MRSSSELGELLEQVALLAAQLARDDDVDVHVEVAGAAAADRRQAARAERDRLPRLRAGGDLDREVAVEARHLDGRAERGQRRGDVDHRVEVLGVAHEALVLVTRTSDVEVAVRAAALAGVAAPAQPDPLAVGDPGRDVDRERPLLAHHAGAVADRAGLLGDPAVAAAAVAQRGPHHLAERGPRDRLELAGALAARAGDDRRARLGAVAVAVLAADVGLVGDLDPLAARGLREVDADRDDDVAALDRDRPRPPRPVPNAESKPPEPKNALNRSETEPKPSKFGA